MLIKRFSISIKWESCRCLISTIRHVSMLACWSIPLMDKLISSSMTACYVSKQAMYSSIRHIMLWLDRRTGIETWFEPYSARIGSIWSVWCLPSVVMDNSQMQCDGDPVHLHTSPQCIPRNENYWRSFLSRCTLIMPGYPCRSPLIPTWKPCLNLQRNSIYSN